jgi:hypothetical protein
MSAAKKTGGSTSKGKGAQKRPKPSTTSRKDPAVDAWFAGSDHPLKPLMLKVRHVILSCDKRVTETVKWSTPTFSYHGDVASFIPNARSFVSLLFHRGAEIPGRHPRLAGDSRLARTMRFADEAELAKYRPDLERVIRAWCDSREP